MTGNDSKESQMSKLFPDTRPEAEQVQIKLLRQTPAWRKLEMVGQMNQTLRTLALSGLRQRHPGATVEELRRRLADLLLGPALAAQVYGPLEPPDRGYLRQWVPELGVTDLLEKALTEAEQEGEGQ